jgi:hypothetical protein
MIGMRLADGGIELVRHQRAGDVPAEGAVPGEGRKRPRPEALVGHRVGVGHAEREGRVRIQEELVHVVVVDHEQPVGPQLFQPGRHLGERAEQRLPLLVSADAIAGVVGVLH